MLGGVPVHQRRSKVGVPSSPMLVQRYTGRSMMDMVKVRTVMGRLGGREPAGPHCQDPAGALSRWMLEWTQTQAVRLAVSGVGNLMVGISDSVNDAGTLGLSTYHSNARSAMAPLMMAM